MSAPLRLLLVDPDAPALAPQVAARVPATVTPAATPETAEAYLAGATFDAVALRADLPGGTAVRERAAQAGATLHVYADEAALLVALGAPADADDARAALAEVRDRLADLAHTLNNPLAIISGHAQLGREIAAATDVDPDIVAAFDGIRGGVDKLVERLDEIKTLRQLLERRLG